MDGGERTERRMTPAITMHEVTKRFKGRLALDALNWSVATSSIHGLIGANGAGKTTLLRLALGVLWPDSGEVAVLGERLARDNADNRQRVHYVASGRSMPSHFRVNDWLHYMNLLYERWDAARCQRLLEAMEIPQTATIRSLSTGMQASLQLAVAIATRPELLLLDEPTNGMDVVVKRQVLQLIIDMAAAEGTTVVFATHNIEDVERMADTVSVLHRGCCILTGAIDQIKSHMRRLQVVGLGRWSDDVFRDPHIARVERRGHVALVTTEGDDTGLEQRLKEAGAMLVEPIDMDLAEIFRMVLEKEGYSRDTLSWDS